VISFHFDSKFERDPPTRFHVRSDAHKSNFRRDVAALAACHRVCVLTTVWRFRATLRGLCAGRNHNTTNIWAGRKFDGRVFAANADPPATRHETSTKPAHTNNHRHHHHRIVRDKSTSRTTRTGPCSQRPRRQDDACATEAQPLGPPWDPHSHQGGHNNTTPPPHSKTSSNHASPRRRSSQHNPPARPPARRLRSTCPARPSPASAPPTSAMAPPPSPSPAKSPSQTQTCPYLPP
jgi:hypothetical protein